MKTFGKFQKRPAAKKLLIQTYITSLICLMLCVTMFFGTTAAWFTSTVTTPKNQIMVGTLKVELNHASFSNGILGGYSKVTDTYSILKDTVKWEPNYTAVEKFEIVEKGDLAFAYQMTIDFGFVQIGDNSTEDDKKTYAAQEAVTKAITVWTYTGEDTSELPADFKSMIETEKWTEVGTLFDVINGQLPVFQGSMNSETVKSVNDDAKVTHMIALHMDEKFSGLLGEGADEFNIQGTKLNDISITLVATQAFSEKDAFGSNYDEKKVDLSATEEVKTDASNMMTEAAVISVTDTGSAISSASVSVPAGTKLADGNKNLTLKVEQKDTKTANIEIKDGWSVLPLDITLDGLASNAANNGPFVVTLNMPAGLSNVTVYHKGNEMSSDANSAEYFTYDVATGILTLKVNSFSPFDVVYGSDYVTTEEALKAALVAGGDVTLGSDIQLTKEIRISKNARLNLNGHNLSASLAVNAASGTTVHCILIENGATLTVVGHGDVTMESNVVDNTNVSVALFRNQGNLILESGNYTVTDKSTPVDGAWIISTIVDTCLYSGDAVTTINGGTYRVTGAANNLFRNYPTSDTGTTAKLVINGGFFYKNPLKEFTYIWNQQNSAKSVTTMEFNGGVYEGVVYEDYYSQSDITVTEAATAGGLKAYSGNS